LGAGLIYNHSEFRLMGRKAILALAEYNEKNLFLRGVVPVLGYETGIVYYNMKKRSMGKSKYTLWKTLKLAFCGITSLGKIRPKAKRRPENHIEQILFSKEIINAG